jgi:hypothetical protein
MNLKESCQAIYTFWFFYLAVPSCPLIHGPRIKCFSNMGGNLPRGHQWLQKWSLLFVLCFRYCTSLVYYLPMYGFFIGIRFDSRQSTAICGSTSPGMSLTPRATLVIGVIDAVDQISHECLGEFEAIFVKAIILFLYQGPGWSCLMKKRDGKSRNRVPF